MKHPDYPNVSSMTDRHGKTRWRFRRSGHKDVMLPYEPHTSEFDQAYRSAILGIKAEIVQHPNSASPYSMKSAYRILKDTNEWRSLDDKSKRLYQQTIERVLTIPVGNKNIGDGALSELKRSHIKAILDQFRDTPHMERIILICLRKLIYVGIDEEWIETAPTYKMKHNPQTDGHKA